MKIAVLIPCYNESKTIAKVVADYRAALPEADIYVYDNNSPTTRTKSPVRPEPSSATNTGRARATSSARCSGKSRPIVI